MGFPSVSVKMPQLFSVRPLLSLLSQIEFMFTMALTRLGLLEPAEQVFDGRAREDTAIVNYVYVMHGLCPIAVPVHIVTEAIKETLPVVNYGGFLERLGKRDHDDEDQRSTTCVVCLDYVQESDEIRELCNCCHVFHVRCLDGWMDVDRGQVTCPSCRSMLFPSNIWNTIRSKKARIHPLIG